VSQERIPPTAASSPAGTLLEAELFAEALALVTAPYACLDGLPERIARLAARADEHGFGRILALARLAEVDVLNRTRHILDGVEITQEALRWATGVGDDLVTARAHALLATGLYRLGAWAEAVPHAEAGVRLLDESAPLEIQADHALILAMLTTTLRSGPVASSLFEHANDLARRLGDPVMIVANLNNLACIRHEAGDLTGAAEAVDQLRAVAADCGHELNTAVLDTVAAVLLARGEATEAARLINQALDGRASVTDADSLAGAVLTYAEIKLRAGDHLEALRAVKRARQLTAGELLAETAAMALRKLAAIRAAMGDYPAAYEAMVRFHAEWENMRTQQGEATVSVMQALFDIEKARRDSLHYQELSERDALTGLWNRRHLERRLPVLLREALTSARPVGIGLVDLDHFKQINDCHSHDTGDAVLRTVARILDQVAGSEVFATRLGGEEFLAVFLDSDGPATMAACEKLRRMVESYPWSEHAAGLVVTASVGVTTAVAGDTLSTLLRRADEHLYRSKRKGRNRVTGDAPVATAI
jgi:diguanylate cyclase (GGDEF)-like protein